MEMRCLLDLGWMKKLCAPVSEAVKRSALSVEGSHCPATDPIPQISYHLVVAVVTLISSRFRSIISSNYDLHLLDFFTHFCFEKETFWYVCCCVFILLIILR